MTCTQKCGSTSGTVVWVCSPLSGGSWFEAVHRSVDVWSKTCNGDTRSSLTWLQEFL